MRLSEITFNEFMGHIVHEYDIRSPEMMNSGVRVQALLSGERLIEGVQTGAIVDYEFFKNDPDAEFGSGLLEVREQGSRVSLFSVLTSKDNWELDSTEIVNGTVIATGLYSSVFRHLLKRQDSLQDYLDLDATIVSQVDIEIRIALHRAATIEAYEAGDDIHPENYDKYIAPYIDPETNDFFDKRKRPVADYHIKELHETQFNAYCHPNRKVIKASEFGPFELSVIEKISRNYRSLSETLSAYGPQAFIKEHRLREIRKSSVDDSRLFADIFGCALLTNRDATIIKAMTQEATTFVPEEFRGRGYSADLLLSLGSHHREFLAPTHFSEGGIAARQSAHRQAVVEAHNRGDWIRPSIKAHYAEVLGLEADLNADLEDDSAPASMSM